MDIRQSQINSIIHGANQLKRLHRVEVAAKLLERQNYLNDVQVDEITKSVETEMREILDNVADSMGRRPRRVSELSQVGELMSDETKFGGKIVASWGGSQCKDVEVPSHPDDINQKPHKVCSRTVSGDLRIESVYNDFNRLWFVQGQGLAIFCGYDAAGKTIAEGELEHQKAMAWDGES